MRGDHRKGPLHDAGAQRRRVCSGSAPLELQRLRAVRSRLVCSERLKNYRMFTDPSVWEYTTSPSTSPDGQTALNESASHSLVQVLLSIHARCCVPTTGTQDQPPQPSPHWSELKESRSHGALSGKESNRLAPVCHRLPTGAFQPADLSRGTPVRVKLPQSLHQMTWSTRVP